jgi:hypothetical protein
MNASFHSRWSGELQEFIEFRRTYFTSEWPESTLRRFDACAVLALGLSHRSRLTLIRSR